MSQPIIKTDIEARVMDIGDTMTGSLFLKKNEAYVELFIDDQTNYCTYLSYRKSPYIGQILIQKDKAMFSKYDGTNWNAWELLHVGNIKNNLKLIFDYNQEIGKQTQDAYDFNTYRPGVTQFIWGGYIKNSPPWTAGSNHYGNLLTIGNTNSYMQQIIFDNVGPTIYHRKFHEGTWGNWATLLTSASGTAISATKLATARNFSIADNDGSNFGPTVSFNGTTNTVINLPSTIKATLKGNATTASELEYFMSQNPSDNAAGYRLIYQGTPGTWANSRCTLGISSRHNGNGIVCIAFGCNNSTVSADTVYGQIIYYGNNNNASSSTGSVFYKDMFLLYYNASTNKFSLFAKYTDYSTIKLKILNSYATGGLSTIVLSNFSNGAYVSSVDTTTYGNQICQTQKGWAEGDTITGAVWNDYAEFRDQEEEIPFGYCAASADDGRLSKTTHHLQACDGIVSDTYGFAIGETENCRTPLAVAGRVLAYCEGDRYDYHAGDTVGASANGKVIKMTREEIKEYPDRIIGHVSEIPEYETWGTGNVPVNGRIWIKVK